MLGASCPRIHQFFRVAIRTLEPAVITYERATGKTSDYTVWFTHAVLATEMVSVADCGQAENRVTFQSLQ